MEKMLLNCWRNVTLPYDNSTIIFFISHIRKFLKIIYLQVRLLNLPEKRLGRRMGRYYIMMERERKHDIGIQQKYCILGTEWKV